MATKVKKSTKVNTKKGAASNAKKTVKIAKKKASNITPLKSTDSKKGKSTDIKSKNQVSVNAKTTKEVSPKAKSLTNPKIEVKSKAVKKTSKNIKLIEKPSAKSIKSKLMSSPNVKQKTVLDSKIKVVKADVKASASVKNIPNTNYQKNTPKKQEKASKPTHSYVKFEMEFPMHTSRNSLFTFLTDASALSSWFADHVDVTNNDDYIFSWDGVKQQAKVISWKESQMVRYKWQHEPEGTYFEFTIVEDELTFDLALLITDFAEDVQSVEASKRLWQSQIDDLHHAIGG